MVIYLYRIVTNSGDNGDKPFLKLILEYQLDKILYQSLYWALT